MKNLVVVIDKFRHDMMYLKNVLFFMLIAILLGLTAVYLDNVAQLFYFALAIECMIIWYRYERSLFRIHLIVVSLLSFFISMWIYVALKN